MYFSSTSITEVVLDDNGGQWHYKISDLSAANLFWVKDLLWDEEPPFKYGLEKTDLIRARMGGKENTPLEWLQEFQKIVFLRYWYGRGGLQGYLCIDKEPNAGNSAGCEGVSQSFWAVRYLASAWSLAQSVCLSCQPRTRFLSCLFSFFL